MIAVRFRVPKGRSLVAVGERSDTHECGKENAPDPEGVKHVHECDPFFRVGEIILNNPWVSPRSPTAIELHPFGMKPRSYFVDLLLLEAQLLYSALAEKIRK